MSVITVDVIVPLRNEERYLPKLIQQLEDQDVPPENIYLTVAPSIDRTLEISLAAARRSSRFSVLNNPEGTAPAAMNVALRECSSDGWMRIDGHTEIPSDLVRVLVEEINRTGSDCVGPLLTPGGRTLRQAAIGAAMSSPIGVGSARFRTGRGRSGPTDAVAFGLYRRSSTDRLGGFNEEMVRNQDDEFNTRLRRIGGSLWLTDRTAVTYFPRENYRKLARQYRQYGFWRMFGTVVHGNQLRARQVAPACLVVSGIGSASLSAARRESSPAMLFATGYLAILLGQVGIAKRNGASWKVAVGSAAGVAAMHWAYGLGSIAGSLFGVRRRARSKNG